MTQIQKAGQVRPDSVFQITLLKIATKAMMETLSTAQLRRLAAYILEQSAVPRPVHGR